MKLRAREKAGIIYHVKNKITGKAYIGATTNSIHQRKLDHEERAKRRETHPFAKAIATYGPDAFTWEQVDTASNVDELAQLEKQYIFKYNSKEDGYNADSGGGFKKTVYQYDLKDGKLIKKFDCLESAAYAVNATKQQLSRACLSVNNKFNGYYWSYEFPFNPRLDKRFKTVEQIGNDGNVIAKYKSIAEAAHITGVSKTSIAKVCRGERKKAGGVNWRVIKNFKMKENDCEEEEN